MDIENNNIEEFDSTHSEYEAIVTYLIEESFKNTSPEYIQQGEVYNWLMSIVDEEE